MSSFRAQPGGSSIWSIERVVALLTPVFSAAAGYGTSLVGKLIPGTSLSKTDLTALFIAGATFAGGAALKWLHGRQKFTQFVTDADSYADKVVAKIKANQLAGPALADIEGALKAHESNIIDAVSHTIKLPPSAEEIAKQLVSELWPHANVPGETATAGTAAGAPTS